MKPRRILIFSMAYYPRMVGGAEVAVKEITGRLPSADFEFDLIALNAGGEAAFEKIGNVDVHRVGSGFGPVSKILYPLAAAKLARRLQTTKSYDAVWAIMASYAGFAALKFKKCHPNIPLVLTIQEGDHFKRREGIFRPFFRSIFKAADRIQVISNFLADWSRKMGAKCPIEVVPNGVDLANFSKPLDPAERHKIRAELGFKESDNVLVTASRLVHKNAVDDIISALAYLESSFKLLIIGTGTDEAELKSQAARLKLSDRIVFKGFVPHSDLPAYLQAADIFVRPSRTEGLGNSFLEAMAAGIPVIATPVGGIPDFLTDGETGLFCEVGNPRSIAQKAEKLARDRESRDYIVSQAKKMVMERYSWDGVAQKMQAIFETAKTAR